MGIFDYFFSHAKQKQDKPIRDKIKNRKHFEKVLEKRMTEIHEDKLTISNGCNNLFINRVIADNSIDVIFVKYSMDADIKELKDIYMDSLSYFLHGFEKENPIYNDILNRVSLGVLLNIPDDNIKQLITYVRRMDEQAKPADWTPDLLLWFMLNSRMDKDKIQTHANKLAFPKLYKGLFKLTQLSDAQAAKKALIDYIGKWYNLNKDAPWYNNHLKTRCYRGYWAWEVAAVAKILHIDDSDLKDNPYYPYDMVHWEEDNTTNDE